LAKLMKFEVLRHSSPPEPEDVGDRLAVINCQATAHEVSDKEAVLETLSVIIAACEAEASRWE